jgi:hypothetical protein
MSSSDTPEAANREMVIYDFDPRNLPPDLLRAIGLVVAASAQTESIVQELIGALLKIDNIETRALTAHMSAPLKDQVARALAELSAPSVGEVDTIDDLLDAVNSAYEKRNVIVHNSLARNPDTGEVLSYREVARGSLRVSLQPVRVEQVEQDAATIYEAGIAIMRFMISRGIGACERTAPLHVPIDRRKKARTIRRDLSVGDGY